MQADFNARFIAICIKKNSFALEKETENHLS